MKCLLFNLRGAGSRPGEGLGTAARRGGTVEGPPERGREGAIDGLSWTGARGSGQAAPRSGRRTRLSLQIIDTIDFGVCVRHA